MCFHIKLIIFKSGNTNFRKYVLVKHAQSIF